MMSSATESRWWLGSPGRSGCQVARRATGGGSVLRLGISVVSVEMLWKGHWTVCPRAGRAAGTTNHLLLWGSESVSE